MIRVPINRPPTRPGEMILEEPLFPMNLPQRMLPNAILVSYRRFHDLTQGRYRRMQRTAIPLANFL